MAKLQLKRSNVLEGTEAKAPSSAMMEFGELAVNYNSQDPTIFIKDSSGAIIPITRLAKDGDIGPKGNKGFKGQKGRAGATGKKGERGFQGTAGTEGQEGQKGIKGQKGRRGSKGNVGDKGSVTVVGEIIAVIDEAGPPNIACTGNTKGSVVIDINEVAWICLGAKWEAIGTITGPEGAQGPKGDIGLKGEKGNVGNAGQEGAEGEKGLKGQKGEMGRVGPGGLKGEKGTKGFKGNRGVKGNIGEEGVKGQQGKPGEKGNKGKKGEIGRGVKGQKGSKGNKGKKGNKGIKGNKGQKGVKGHKGQKGKPSVAGQIVDVINEPGPPPANMCFLNGDIIVDSEGIAWVCNIEKGWISIGSYKGTQGKKGEKGDRGLAGEKGSVGNQGEKGELGKGQKGDKGDRGETGIKGLKGQKGKKGQKGVKGKRGNEGLKGERGSKGEVGTKGEKGTKFLYEDFTEEEINALVGQKGERGERGFKGERGKVGDTGDTGQKGEKGSKGHKGNRGITGAKGNKGGKGTSVIVKGRLDYVGPPRAPEAEFPEYNEMWIDTNGVAWIYRVSSNEGDEVTYEWFNVGQIVGDKGNKGNLGTKGNKGNQGIKGDAFEYDDFTEAALKGLTGPEGQKGERGLQGDKGPKGNLGRGFVYEDFTDEQIKGLKGPKGNRGFTGADFEWSMISQEQKDQIKGERGETGDEGEKGQRGETGEKGRPITWEDMTKGQKDAIKGNKGERGIQGERGEKGNKMTMDDLSPEDKEEIRGEQGDNLEYEDLTDEQKAEIRGEKGNKGDLGSSVNIVGSLDYVGQPQPPQSDGANTGDMWIDAEGDGWVYTGGAWSNVGKIQGTKGNKGDAGKAGSDANAGDGGINVNVLSTGGLNVTGSNATANQTANTTRTLSLKLDGTTLSTSENGVKVNDVPWSIVSNTPSTYPPSTHSHTFDSLTNKTAGTGNYATTGYLISGYQNGSAALTINDGYGNANVTFNHVDGIPGQDGNAGRIECNTDSLTGAQISLEVKSGVQQGVKTGTAERLRVSDVGVESIGVNFVGNLTGNADTATTATSAGSATNADEAAEAVKLKTSRTLWGQSFDGTENVSGDITGASNVFGTNTNMTVQPADSTSNRHLYLRGNNNTNSNGGNVYIGNSARGSILFYSGNTNAYRFYKEGSGSIHGTLRTNQLTGNRKFTLPDKDGIFAMVGDIPSIPTVGNGQIRISAGNGLAASGGNATANQTENTNRTLSVKLDGTTIAASANGIKVNSVPWTSVTDAPSKYPNADKLDGLDSTKFLRSDINTTAEGIVKLNAKHTGSLNLNKTTKTTYTGITFSELDDGRFLLYLGNTENGGLGLQARRNGGSFKTVWTVDNGTGVLNFGTEPTIQHNKVWHAGNDGEDSGLDADKLHGAVPDPNVSNNTIVERTSSGDVQCRLARSTYQNQDTISGAIAYRINTSSNNFIRFCSDPAAIREFLDVPSTSNINAAKVRVDHDAGNKWHRPVFVDDNATSTSYLRLRTDSASTIAINPSTNRIRAARFDGPLNGTASNASKLDEVSRPKNWGVDCYSNSAYENDVDANAAANRVVGSSVFMQSSTNTPNPSGHLWTVAGGDTSDRGIQFFSTNANSGELWMRCLNGKTWHKVWTSGSDEIRVSNTIADDKAEIRIQTYRPAIRFKDMSDNVSDAEIVMDQNLLRFRLSREVNETTALTSRMTLSHTGTLTCTGDVVAYSDARVKKNIEPITNALSKVEQLNGVTFERTDIEEEKRHAGLIAQDVEKVLPEVINEAEDGIKSVAYGNITGLLVEAIKELKAEIQELKSK